MASFALVTGAADRIGKAFALALAQMGYNIFLHYNTSSEKAGNACRLIEDTGQKCILKQADFRSEEQISRLIGECAREEKLEILVNNASNFVESNRSEERRVGNERGVRG